MQMHPTPNAQRPKVKYTLGAKLFISFLLVALGTSIAALLYVIAGY